VTAGAPALRVDALRRAFDESFAAEAAAATAPAEALLAIRLRDEPHLLRLADVGRLLRVGRLVRYPAAAPAWLGLAGVAGGVVPVYDLGVLAGHPAGALPAWMAVCAAAPVALAFDAFEGQVRHLREPAADAAGGAAPAGTVLRVEGGARPVVDVPALLARLRASMPAPAGATTSTPSPTPAAAADREN
jgi:purine-binding chemotaxis protein CheW